MGLLVHGDSLGKKKSQTVLTLFNRMLNMFSLNKAAPCINDTNIKNTATQLYLKKQTKKKSKSRLTDKILQTLLTLFVLSGTHMVLQTNMP